MTQKEFEEELVFNKYKDGYIESCKKFRKEVSEFKNIDAREVYTRIINYQVATYGGSLSNNGTKEFQDFDLYRRKANQRKSFNNRYYGIDTRNSKKNRWME
jgi:hypothetical protein